MKSKFTVHEIEDGLDIITFDGSDYTPDFVKQSAGVYVADISAYTTNYENVFALPRFMRDHENGIDIFFGAFVDVDGDAKLMLKTTEGATPVDGYLNNLSFEVAV